MLFNFEIGINAIIYSSILSVVVSQSSRKYFVSDEDRYVEKYGNKPDNAQEWFKVIPWCREKDQLKVKKMCAAAHKKLMPKGRYMIEKVAYKSGILTFNSRKYQPMRVAYLEYNLQSKKIPLELKQYSVLNENEHWYLTDGFYKGCVFYLNLMKNSSVPEFSLGKHVCGLKHKYVVRPPRTKTVNSNLTTAAGTTDSSHDDCSQDDISHDDGSQDDISHDYGGQDDMDDVDDDSHDDIQDFSNLDDSSDDVNDAIDDEGSV